MQHDFTMCGYARKRMLLHHPHCTHVVVVLKNHPLMIIISGEMFDMVYDIDLFLVEKIGIFRGC